MNAEHSPIDFIAAKGKKILAHLLQLEESKQQAEDAIRRNADDIRSDWREYGALLLELRAAISNDQKFHAAIVANGWDAQPAQDSQTRSDAMWLAEHWAEVSKLSKPCPFSRPNSIHQWCRKQGYEWAMAQRKSAESKATEETQQTSTTKNATATPAVTPTAAATTTKKTDNGKTYVGWTRAVEIELGGTMYDGYRRNTLVHLDSPSRIKLEEAYRREYGKSLPDKNETIEVGGQEAKNIAALLTRLWTLENEEAAEARAAEARAKVAPGEQEKIDAAVKQACDLEFARLNKGFEAAVENGVREARLNLEDKANYFTQLSAKLQAERATIEVIMTHEEFRIVRSCLHPDRDVSREKLSQAFAIFNRLEATCNPDQPAWRLKQYQWSDVAPYKEPRK